MSDSRFQLERVRAPVSDEELISDMRRVAERAGTNAVSFRMYSESGNHHPSTVALRFGTWNKISARAKQLCVGRISDDRRDHEAIAEEHFEFARAIRRALRL